MDANRNTSEVLTPDEVIDDRFRTRTGSARGQTLGGPGSRSGLDRRQKFTAVVLLVVMGIVALAVASVVAVGLIIVTAVLLVVALLARLASAISGKPDR